MIEQHAFLFHLYRTALVRTFRALVLFFVVVLILADVQAGIFPKFSLFILIWFTIIEIFFHFKIAKTHPGSTVARVSKEKIKDAYTFQLLEAYVATHTITGFLKQLANLPQVRTLLEKIEVTLEELSDNDVTREQIGEYAVELVKKLNGSYVTTPDFVVSYLLLTEDKTKLLFSKKIKPEELLQVLDWIRTKFPHEEHPKKSGVSIFGGGFGESMIVGWTPETAKYTSDFTYRAIKSDPLSTGREEVFNSMLQGLVKANNNNLMVVGDAGSGKENLVALLAKKSFSDELGPALNNKTILELMLGPLIAGTSDRGLLEGRLQNIIAEVAHSSNVIVYIPEFQNILGSSSYNIDLSGAILPYLKEGYIPIIATLTPGNYKAYLERNPLREVFEVIHLPEPDENTAIHMVLDRTDDIERKYRVIIPYLTAKAGVKYAKRYLQDDVLPGAAITLIEDSANTVAITKHEYYSGTKRKIVTTEDIAKKVEEKAHVSVAEPTGVEKEVLLHLEDKLHERVIDQEQAIRAIAEAMRRLRSGLSSTTKPISFLFLGPTGVGKTETAKALAAIYFGGEEKMIRLDMSEYTDDDGVKRLLGAPPGEGSERGELTDKVHDNPASLILLDEFEKANPKIRDLFLQVLDDGRLTDNKGKTVSFANTIIIATSNAGSEFIRERIKEGVAADSTFHQALLNTLQVQGIFKPELLNRFDDVVTFLPLGQAEVKKITALLLKEIVATLAEDDITVTFDEQVVSKIANEGYDREFGARPIRRYIQSHIDDLLAKKRLNGEIQRGSKILLTVDAAQNIVCKVS
jgi:ATP-dependent Clp protease ATP-binding subunit ClpC